MEPTIVTPFLGLIGVLVGAIVTTVGQELMARRQRRHGARSAQTDAAVAFLAAADALLDEIREMGRLMGGDAELRAGLPDVSSRYGARWGAWVEARARLRVLAHGAAS